MTWLADAVENMTDGDRAAGDAVRDRAADILRPAGALARLDEVAAWVAEWQRSPNPAVRKPAALIFAADHGVAAAGVSKYPVDVTAAMLAAYRAGKSTSVLAAVAGANVDATMGVGDQRGYSRVGESRAIQRRKSVGRAVSSTDLLVGRDGHWQHDCCSGGRCGPCRRRS